MKEETRRLIPMWQERARRLKREVFALTLAFRDPRVPWYAKLLTGAVVAYALSPIDLIPDFIPVLGYLDDLILIPAGIALVLKMIPPAVLAECHARATAMDSNEARWSRIGAGIIIALWLLGGTAAIFLLLRAILR